MKKVVIVIPTYNEKENIKLLIEKIKREIKNIKSSDVEVLVVDGNSPDGTAQFVEEFGRKHKFVKLFLEKKKKGLGAAYLYGMKYAFEKMKADLAIAMDADLSHDPYYLPKFVSKVDEGYDFVVGSRYIKGGSIPKNWPFHRKFLSIFGNLVTQALLGKSQIQDWTTGYRAIRKKVYFKVAPHMEKDIAFRGYTFNISFAYHAIEAGFKAGQVPINFVDRIAGESKLGLEYLVYTPLFLVKTRLKKLLSV